MIEVTYMLCFFVLIHFVNCLSSPSNHQPDKLSSPADDFFNFDNEPFAKHLADTYSTKSYSPSVSKDVTVNNSDIQKDDNGARRTDKPYQYAPRKSSADLRQTPTAKRSRKYQQHLRLHLEKLEIRLASKRAYERSKKGDGERKRIYKRFGRPQTKMTELIRLEKLNGLDEVQKEELHHQRMLKKKSNEKYRKKPKNE